MPDKSNTAQLALKKKRFGHFPFLSNGSLGDLHFTPVGTMSRALLCV
jgi:hypothetical protein